MATQANKPLPKPTKETQQEARISTRVGRPDFSCSSQRLSVTPVTLQNYRKSTTDGRPVSKRPRGRE